MQKLIFFIILIYTSNICANDFTSNQLSVLAKNFISAKNSRQQPNTRIEDIDKYLSLIADIFIDEHIQFNVTITDKLELRKSMIYKMKDQIIYSSIEINEIMTGNNVVFIKMTETGKVKPSHLDKIIEYTNTNIISLEFNDKGLITHIRRHHG